MFGTVFVAGPRQVGKTTMLQKLTEGMNYVSLDDYIVFLCGTQQFQMMRGASESLAGRIGIVTLLGFSMRERYGIANDMPFLPTKRYFAERKKQLADIPYGEVWQLIHRGSMPKLWENPDFDGQMFYLLKPGVRRGPGGVVCLYDTLISFRGNDCVIPIQYL